MNSQGYFEKYLPMIMAEESRTTIEVSQMLMKDLVADVNALSDNRGVKLSESYLSCIKEVNDRYISFVKKIEKATKIKMTDTFFVDNLPDRWRDKYYAKYKRNVKPDFTDYNKKG